jgi:L,D-peptidoglycan transpeptidase YkuD (ErfK/YbiS/YcfS/YnhG family)
MKAQTFFKRGGLLESIAVRGLPGSRSLGRVEAEGVVFPCVLGRSGITIDKREGDGATPAGRYTALDGYWRHDRVERPLTALSFSRIEAASGWCDDPNDRNYNKPVTLPYGASTEKMRREDGLYDIVVDLDWNRGPIARGRGSAIFLHVAAPNFSPTEGCIALRMDHLRKLLARIGRQTIFDVRR